MGPFDDVITEFDLTKNSCTEIIKMRPTVQSLTTDHTQTDGGMVVVSTRSVSITSVSTRSVLSPFVKGKVYPKTCH